MKDAVAAPEPVLDVPGFLVKSQGLRVTPKAEVIGSPIANSVIFNLPRIIAPDLLRPFTTVASKSGTKSALIFEAQEVRVPLVYIWSLTPTGTPCKGPLIDPAITSASDCLAASNASSAMTVI